ncbi:hypothetical protein JCM11251_000853 [Rhodosporidiobolus azoricus]
MSSSSSHGRHRSSADVYASVPTTDSTYPPIRSITPRSPPLHQDDEDDELIRTPPPPPFADDYPSRRSPSMQTFASEYSNSDAPYRLRGGATGSAAWGADSEMGHDYSPSLGSTANLTALANRNVAAGGAAGYYGKEMESDPPLSTLKKRGVTPGGTAGGGGWWSRKSSRAKKLWIAALVLLLVIIAVAVAVPAAIVSSNNSKNKSSEEKARDENDGTQKDIPTGATPVTDWRTAAYGGNGSMVYMEDGSSFMYNNSFGGYWVSIPFNDTARPQRDTPRLNETWNYETDLIQGVNIGGWLVLEPFIVPGMFEPFNNDGIDPNEGGYNAIDEWTLSEQLTAQGNLTAAMREHYDTFITEKDFAEIAAAGLNWVRIPIGWWAVETWSGEPFLANVSWEYFLKAITWARKYGLRINLDLHAVPGSQNGYNHSGKQGSINLLNGLMGIANAQRTLSYIRTITEFISQPEYKNVVPMFSILNEPSATSIGVEALRTFYVEVYNQMRDASGLGEGNGPFLVFHDGFVRMAMNVSSGGWDGFLNGWDRVGLDSHRYLCFDQQNEYGLSYQAALPCNYWAQNMNISTNEFGLTIGAEWSLAINDCGKWLNNVGNGERYEGTYYIPNNLTAPDATYPRVGDCTPWRDYTTWNSTTIDGLRLVAEAHMDALRHWFFWTWKTGFSTQLGQIANPMWNYQLGLEKGYVPTNPRTAMGACPSLVTSNGFSIGYTTQPAPTLAPWMTGGVGAGTIQDQAMYTSYAAWPPASISGAPDGAAYPVSLLPTYTPTGNIITMTAQAQPTAWPSGYSSSVDVGNGWANPSDTAGQYTPAADCTYVDAWSGAGVAVPTTSYCGGGAAEAKMKRYVKSTPNPTLVAPTPPPRPAPTAARRW